MNTVDQESTKSQGQMIDVRVAAIHYAVKDIHVFELEPLDGRLLPAAEPGAHIELHLQNNVVRHYSLINPNPRPKRYVIGVKRDDAGRGGSRYIHDRLRVGASVRISPPRNNFKLDQTASHTVLIAGGIGITPILSMARQLDELGRAWTLYYAARSRTDAAFLDEFDGRQNVTFHMDNENPGVLLDFSKIIAAAPRGAHFYCCGPSPMLHGFEAEAGAQLPAEQVHVEYFVSIKESAVEGGFVVELAKSQQEFPIPPGKSILQVLLDADLNVAHSCTEGICGACETRVLSGIPDHRDSVSVIR